MRTPLKPVSFRLDEVSIALLEAMVEEIKNSSDTLHPHKINKTDVLQKAIHYFARECVLPEGKTTEIIDKHYKDWI